VTASLASRLQLFLYSLINFYPQNVQFLTVFTATLTRQVRLCREKRKRILLYNVSEFAGDNLTTESRDSSVGMVLGYGLDDRGSRVRFPAGTGNFSLHRRVQNGSGAHPASYPMGTRGSFPGDKAAGA
jgi:hypothetical protein